MSNLNTMPLRDLVRLLNAGAFVTSESVWTRLASFFAAAIADDCDLSDAVVVQQPNNQVLWACVSIRSPGRTGLVIMGPVPPQDHHVLIAALNQLADLESRHGTNMLQALLPDTQHAEISLVTRAGLNRLAELVYMQTALPGSLLETQQQPDWPIQPGDDVLNYSDATADAFAATVQATYLDTHDCPALEGMRRMEDVMAGHRGSGVFHPELWFLFRRTGRPAGIVLLNELNSQSPNGTELVYMGLVPAARGQRLARHVLQYAMRQARAAGFRSMLLAVDAANPPALRLYQGLGFRETMRRVAFIRKLERPR